MHRGTYSDGTWIIAAGLVILILAATGGEFERTLFDIRVALGLD